MGTSEYVSYMTFISILLVGILYLYWLDESEISSEEESGMDLNWIPFHKLVEDSEKRLVSSEAEAETTTDRVTDGNWLCKVDQSGKEIELVKPIEHYVSSGGSQFATLYS